MNPIWDGQVNDGKLLLDKSQQFKDYLRGLSGKRVQVTVEKIKHSRTLQQNRYLWGVCYKLIADHTGAEPEEVHSALKFNFAPKRFIGNLVAPSSTSRLDTIAFTDYIEKVRRWAAEELNINIPDPNESFTGYVKTAKFRSTIIPSNRVRFCSLDCSVKFRVGSRAAHYKGDGSFMCQTCFKQVHTTPGQAGIKKYCSKKCYAVSKRGKLTHSPEFYKELGLRQLPYA